MLPLSALDGDARYLDPWEDLDTRGMMAGDPGDLPVEGDLLAGDLPVEGDLLAGDNTGEGGAALAGLHGLPNMGLLAVSLPEPVKERGSRDDLVRG